MDIKSIVKAAYPSYRGRKIRISEHTSNGMNTNSYWDGGSRDTFTVVDLATLQARPIPGINPISPPANWRDPTTIEAGTAIVEHSIFCGKDAGCTVHIRPEDRALISGEK
jgi:hypothetical protein